MHTTELLNTALAGRYTIERLVGEGGMATVYLARDVKHNRNVALKVLKPDLGAIVGVERFLSEIQVTANLQHPNLLPLFDSGVADDVLFYVMPHVDGESLRAKLDREKQLPVDNAVQIATAVASALDYAHRHGVIHRDLKPENILMHDGQPLVADFGIALAVSNAGGSRITQTGLSLGTPMYMSPEQAMGDRAIDARSDVYSLGAMTYEMLTGEAPHTGSTSQAIIARLLTEKPRSIRSSRPTVTAHVEAAVDRALEKLPADRFATAKEFSEALTGARPITTTATSPALPADTGPPRRKPATREFVAWSLVVVGAAVIGGLATRSGPPPPATAEFEVQLPDSHVIGARAGYAVALSNDGATVVLAAQLPDARERMLYVRRLDDRTVQPIKGTEDGVSPSFSPDGSEVLFTTAAGGLRRVSVRGGTSRSVVDSAATNGQASWGDAGQVVYANRGQLWIVSEDGGPPRLLAKPDSSRHHAGYGWPSILPGGKAALITVWKGRVTLDSATIGVVTVPGGEVTELPYYGTNPRYSATGHVLFATRDNVLFSVAFSARSLRATGSVSQVAEGVQGGPGGPAGFAIAANGTLAFVGGASASRGQTLVAVTRAGVERPLNQNPGNYWDPSVSPDGRRVALSVDVAGGGSPDIWIFDARSAILTRLTTDSVSDRPAWIADGERVAYTRWNDTVAWWRPLYRTGEAKPLARATKPILEIDPGPKGGHVAFRVTGGVNNSADVYLAPMDSAGPSRPLYDAPYYEQAPRQSPDGRLIAFMTNETGREEVYVQAIAGGPKVRVSADGGAEPVWARGTAGRELFFRGPAHMMLARLTDQPRLDMVRVDTLFRDTYVKSGWHPQYDVFPDGRELLMLRRAGSATVARPVIVVMNWRPGRVAAAQAGGN